MDYKKRVEEFQKSIAHLRMIIQKIMNPDSEYPVLSYRVKNLQENYQKLEEVEDNLNGYLTALRDLNVPFDESVLDVFNK